MYHGGVQAQMQADTAPLTQLTSLLFNSTVLSVVGPLVAAVLLGLWVKGKLGLGFGGEQAGGWPSPLPDFL
jgi:hypothetical protein